MEIQGAPRALVAHLERIHAYYARFGNRIWLEDANELLPFPTTMPLTCAIKYHNFTII